MRFIIDTVNQVVELIEGEEINIEDLYHFLEKRFNADVSFWTIRIGKKIENPFVFKPTITEEPLFKPPYKVTCNTENKKPCGI